VAPRLTPHQKLLRTIPEKGWQGTVEDVLKVYGWLYYHAPDNRPINGRIQNVKAGFPDLIAVRGPRHLAIELKRETGKTTPEQDTWLAAFAEAGAECYVWRPSDHAEVLRVLAPGWTT
jgi:VRR-NUC domain